MKFLDFYNPGRIAYSFEFFPPKSEEQIPKTKETIRRYRALRPDFLTVTYGAGGGTRDLTRELTAFIARELDIPSVAHLTCVGHSKSDIDSILDAYSESGVTHVLALRGDPPKGERTFVAHPNGFSCARDLAEHIRGRGGFSIAVAGYPECHPEATSRDTELHYLKEKVDAGGEIVITQLFFDADLYFRFVENARSVGIEVPIVPGVMPIANAGQVKRFTSMCGASIPKEILSRLDELGDDSDAVKKYGVEVAVGLCERLTVGGAPGLHFYTLNKSTQVEQVCAALRTSSSAAGI
ncbi:MAG: methylenetetrahydrofolate reductase [NAD(P)H] [Bdellovibrionales bacterium]|nr:methylenetetrahydrofolate reductase [NAD(P)H] [Bdellovibrionales bacterium]